MEDLFLRFIVFAIAGLVIGYLSGFFGIGGGILRIPLFLDLLPIFGVAHPVVMHVAVGTSVALIIPTAIAASIKQYHLGNLDFGYLQSWALGTFIGVVIGMLILPYATTNILKVIFIIFLVTVGVYVGLVKDTVIIGPEPPKGIAKLSVSAVIGCCSALTGTAGGALTTPALKAFTYPFKKAIAIASATGLVIGVVASIGVIIHGWGAVGRPEYSLGYIDLIVFVAMLPMILVAAPLGAETSNAVSQKWLKWMYTLLLFVIAANMTYHMLG
jgi:uncharacterized membrane protein YfcA